MTLCMHDFNMGRYIFASLPIYTNFCFIRQFSMLAHRLTRITGSKATTLHVRALSVLERFTSPAQPRTPSDIWRSVGGVCFDVDSTVCMDEGIDVLAEHCGVGQAVKEWTSKAMNGKVKFEDALAARLDIIKPSRQDIQECLKLHPPNFTPGIKRLIATLKNKKVAVFFVSGGFRLMIEPIAEEVGIPLSSIYANTIFFAEDGSYNGFDDAELTSRDGGKAQAIEVIKRIHGFEKIAMVGDGVTDIQARPPADLVVGFGGIVTREIVKQEADLFITDFNHLTKLLQ